MADEKLRLVAEVQDNMSPALRKIKDQLNSIRLSPGMQAATGWMKQLGAEAKNFATNGGNVVGVMDAIGIGGLATAGSLAAVVEQMRALGKRSLDMKELSRETGVSIDWLNAFSNAGLNFGVSADSMQSALNHLTEQMPEFRRHIGSLYGLMAQRWPNLTQKLLGEDTAHQVTDIIGQLDKLKNEPKLQAQLANEFFGNGDEIEKLFRNGAQGFFDEFRKQQAALNPINPELLKQAQAFREAQTGFTVSLENFENSAGPTFLKQMTKLVEEAKNVTDALDGKPQNPGEPAKLWGDLKSGDVLKLGSDLGQGFREFGKGAIWDRHFRPWLNHASEVYRAAAEGRCQLSPLVLWRRRPRPAAPDGLFRQGVNVAAAGRAWPRRHNRGRHEVRRHCRVP